MARPSIAVVTVLPVGGLYRYRRGGEAHGFMGEPIHALQHAVEIEILCRL